MEWSEQVTCSRSSSRQESNEETSWELQEEMNDLGKYGGKWAGLQQASRNWLLEDSVETNRIFSLPSAELICGILCHWMLWCNF